MLTLRLKRLMTTFQQRCTWTTKHNVVKMYLCTRYCRGHRHAAMNDEGQMKDDSGKICILTFSSILIIIIIVTFLSVNLISYHRPSSTSCQQGTGTVSPKRIFHHNFFAVFGFPQAALSLIFDGWLQLPLPIP